MYVRCRTEQKRGTGTRRHTMSASIPTRQGLGWLLGFVVLVLGPVLAARWGAEIALFLRVAVVGPIWRALGASDARHVWMVA
jgi:hypothetical protein